MPEQKKKNSKFKLKHKLHHIQQTNEDGLLRKGEGEGTALVITQDFGFPEKNASLKIYVGKHC